MREREKTAEEKIEEVIISREKDVKKNIYREKGKYIDIEINGEKTLPCADRRRGTRTGAEEDKMAFWGDYIYTYTVMREVFWGGGSRGRQGVKGRGYLRGVV